MRKFTVVVTEKYTNTFEVVAEDADDAAERATEMAIERRLPSDNVETCDRTVAVSEGG